MTVRKLVAELLKQVPDLEARLVDVGGEIKGTIESVIPAEDGNEVCLIVCRGPGFVTASPELV